MSNYHILEMTEKEHKVQVAFHISVPNEDNSAIPSAINLRTCIQQYLSGSEIVSIVPWLESGDPTEYTQIQCGEVYEKVEMVEFNANLTLVQKRNVIDARYTALNSNTPDKLRSRFKFWGSNRDVS